MPALTDAKKIRFYLLTRNAAQQLLSFAEDWRGLDGLRQGRMRFPEFTVVRSTPEKAAGGSLTEALGVTDLEIFVPPLPRVESGPDGGRHAWSTVREE